MDAINFRSNRRGCPQTSYYIRVFFLFARTNRFVFLARSQNANTRGEVKVGNRRLAPAQHIVRAHPTNVIGSSRREIMPLVEIA